MTALDAAGTQELSEINDLITRLCASFPAVPRPAVFHIVRQQYEQIDASSHEASICSLIEPVCRAALSSDWPARVA